MGGVVMKYQHGVCGFFLLVALCVTAARVSSDAPACVGSVTVQSDSGPTAAELLRRWAEALGGEKIQNIKNVYIPSLTKIGELGFTSEEWQAAQGQHKQNIYSRHFRTTLMVFNDYGACFRDHNPNDASL